MLTRLLPDQIAQFWPVIKNAIEQSLPPIVGDHPDKMNRILSSALSNNIDVWASYEREGELSRFEGILVTKFIYDDARDTRSLLLYCLYGYDLVTNKSWVSGLETMLKYAVEKRCSQILAYSELPNLIELAAKLGAKTNYTFISFNVNESVKLLNGL